MSQEIEINKAELTDLKVILDLQKEAYRQEAEIYNYEDVWYDENLLKI